MNTSKYDKLAKVCTFFSHAWAALSAIVIAISIIGIFISAGSLREGWNEFNEIFNPYNLLNFIALVALVSPAILASYLSEKFKNKAAENK